MDFRGIYTHAPQPVTDSEELDAAIRLFYIAAKHYLRAIGNGSLLAAELGFEKAARYAIGL